MTIIEKGGRTDRIREAVRYDMEAMGGASMIEQQSAVQEKWQRQQHREMMSVTIADLIKFRDVN